MSYRKPHTILSKATCSRCGRFCGLITSDGMGPIFDECPERHARTIDLKESRCPMYAQLERFQHRRAPGGHAGRGNSRATLEESSPWQDKAIRELEDG